MAYEPPDPVAAAAGKMGAPLRSNADAFDGDSTGGAWQDRGARLGIVAPDTNAPLIPHAEIAAAVRDQACDGGEALRAACPTGLTWP